MLTGGIAATGAATVNTEDAWTEDVFAEMVNFPVATEGMVIAVLKAPVDVVRKPNVVEPAMTVPDVETLNPVPLTVTAEPAGPVAGLSVIWAVAGAACTGCIPANVRPRPTPRVAVSNFTNLNTEIGPRNRQGCPSSRLFCAGRHFPDPKGRLLPGSQEPLKFLFAVRRTGAWRQPARPTKVRERASIVLPHRTKASQPITEYYL